MARKKANKKPPKPADPKPEPVATPPPEAEESAAPNFTKVPSEAQLAERAAELAQMETVKHRKGSKGWTETEDRRVEIEHFQMSMYAAQKSAALADMAMEKFDDAYSEPLAVYKKSGADYKFKFTEAENETVQDGFYQIYARLNPETLAKWGGIFAFIGLIGVAISKVSLGIACNKLAVKIEEARKKEPKEGTPPPEPESEPVPTQAGESLN